MPVKIVNGVPVMDPARLKHRVTFLQQTASSDASGSIVIWAAASPPDVTWAAIEPMHGLDIIKAGQDISQIGITVTMRYRPGRLPSGRLQAPSGSIYIIRAIENVLEMNVWLVLTCLGLGANE